MIKHDLANDARLAELLSPSDLDLMEAGEFDGDTDYELWRARFADSGRDNVIVFAIARDSQGPLLVPARAALVEKFGEGARAWPLLRFNPINDVARECTGRDA